MCRDYSLRRFCEEWRIWIRPILILTYGIFAIIVVPLLIVNTVKDGFTRLDQLILIGGLFVLSAVPVSVWHITQHVIHFTKPILQKHIIRILWMVPIYALNAWIGLFFPAHSVYVDSLRECYEAYVIYNFMVYLLNYLNLGMDLEATMEYKPQVHHFFPLCCIRPWIMGREFIHNCKHGILQYTVVRPITTFISVICELCGVYGEGTFAAKVAFPYMVAINNLSQFVAMYCLVLFYRANKDDLKPMKPIPKFLCIKAVVFFSFFQGVLLNILVYYGFIKNIFGSTDLAGNGNLASLLQNFFLCIEMFIAAVAHIYSFPHYPFHINSPQYWNNPNHNWLRAILSMMDISDIQEDVSEHFGVVSNSVTRHFRGRSNYQPLPRGPRFVQHETKYLMGKRNDGDDELDVDLMSAATSTSHSLVSPICNSPELGLPNTGRRLIGTPEGGPIHSYGTINTPDRSRLNAMKGLATGVNPQENALPSTMNKFGVDAGRETAGGEGGGAGAVTTSPVRIDDNTFNTPYGHIYRREDGVERTNVLLSRNVSTSSTSSDNQEARNERRNSPSR